MVPMKRSQCAFACGAGWRPQRLERHRSECLVDSGREGAVAVVENEPMGSVQWDTVPELLDRPFGCRVVGNVPVQNSSCGDVDEDEDVQPAKRGRDDQEEVAGEDGAGVIDETVRPSLSRSSARSAPHPRCGWRGPCRR